MKHLFSLLFAAFLGCASLSVCPAQGRVGTAAVRDSSDDEEAKVTSTYNEEKNETTVEFRMLGVATAGDQRVLLSVSASYAGRKPRSEPEDVVFILSVASPGGYRYPDIMSMKVMADGKRLPEVLMLNLDKRRLEEDYLETIGTRMKYDIFKQLSKSKTVELTLKDLSLKLDETRIAKLKELDALLHP